MKKRLIAFVLSIVLAVGNVGAVPVFAAETTAEEAVPVEEQEEVSEEIEDADPNIVTEEISVDDPAEPVEEEIGPESVESIEESNSIYEQDAVEEGDPAEEAINSDEEGEDFPKEAEETALEENTVTNEDNKAVGGAVASGTCGESLTWVLKAGTLTISGTGYMSSYSPDYEYYAPWYDYREQITTIIIQSGVTRIGEYAFYNCRNLKSVTIPSSVTHIMYWAFYNCTSLTSVTIPSGVTSIMGSAFNYCSSLTSVTIPDSVTEIGFEAFRDCSSLKSVAIPSGVTSISNGVFRACSNLTSVTIPDSVTSIEWGAFYCCSSLASVTIPDSVTNIEGSAFLDCSSLTSVTIPDSVTELNKMVFSQCSSLTSVTIPDSVTSIGENAFSLCSRLKSVTIPDSVTEIGYRAFYGCSRLKSVTIGSGVTSIGNKAFDGCHELIVYTENEYVINYCKDNNIIVNVTDLPFYDLGDVEISYDLYQAFAEPRGSGQTIYDAVLPFMWSFINDYGSFPEWDNGNYISRDDFVKLARVLSNTEQFKILGATKPDADRNLLRDEDCWTEHLNVDGLGTPWEDTDGWGGSCAGMSTLAMLIENGVLSVSDIDSSAICLADIEPNRDAASAIHFYHVQQGGFYQEKKNNDFYQLGVKEGQAAQLAECERLAQYADENGTLFEITFQWVGRTDDDGWVGQGHTVVGFGLEKNISRTFNDIKYTKRILIYDVAHPYDDAKTPEDERDLYDLYYNDEGQFCIPGYELFSSSIDIYESETDNGKLIFATDDATILNTGQSFFLWD